MTAPFALSSRQLIGIGDLAELVGVSCRALRWYEAQGLITSRRDRYNMRFYDGLARDRVFLVVRLRKAGLPVNEVRELLRLRDAGAPIAERARQRMAKRMSQLDVERAALAAAMSDVEALDTRGGRWAMTTMADGAVLPFPPPGSRSL